MILDGGGILPPKSLTILTIGMRQIGLFLSCSRDKRMGRLGGAVEALCPLSQLEFISALQHVITILPLPSMPVQKFQPRFSA
jgi:hypothetical protein